MSLLVHMPTICWCRSDEKKGDKSQHVLLLLKSPPALKLPPGLSQILTPTPTPTFHPILRSLVQARWSKASCGEPPAFSADSSFLRTALLIAVVHHLQWQYMSSTVIKYRQDWAVNK